MRPTDPRQAVSPAGWHAMIRVTASLLLLAGASSAQPTISSWAPDPVSPSGRLVVGGSGFGFSGANAALLIGGQPAITTSWSDGEIRGYVPESTALGPVAVQVVNAIGSSNPVTVQVVPREADGQVAWRLQLDSNYPGRYVGVAPDGTVYVTDNQRMYAVTPDGGLLWVQSEAGGGLPIEVANDGTIYTFSAGVVALQPDGTVQWTFVPPTFTKVTHGPNLGPDGNLYVVQASFGGGGLGIYSVDPSGQLRWSDPGNPEIFSAGGAPNTPITFSSLADARLGFGHNGSSLGPNASIFTFTLSGSQTLFSSLGCDTFPAEDRFGRLVTVGQGQCGLIARDFDGNVLWTAPAPNSIASPDVPVIGPDGAAYTAMTFSADLWSVDPSGTTRYFKDIGGLPDLIGVTPDNAFVLDGGSPGFGSAGFVRAFVASSGDEAWTVSLPAENGFGQGVWSPAAAFSPDGKTAYVTTRFSGDGPGYSYLYAIGICPSTAGGALYGTGWPGTNGEPTLASDVPVLGEAYALTLNSSNPVATTAVMLLGVAPATTPTNLGGQLLVSPGFAWNVPLPASGFTIQTALPADPSLCGASLYLQALCVDPGASHGVSFSKGLQLDLGY